MISHVLQSIIGIEIYSIISLLFFLIFFIAVIIWVVRLDRNYLKKMKELPLEQAIRISNDGEKYDDR